MIQMMHKSAIALPAILLVAAAVTGQTPAPWQTSFAVDRKTLGTGGANPYFPLTPGYHLIYKDGNTADTWTVLAETKRIDGVETRVVEDREEKNGALVELTRDYFAIDSATNDVYYFGEDVAVYRKGKVVGHEGSWL